MSITGLVLSPLKIFDGFVDRIFSVTFAVLFAQMPQFIAQYIQRLGGHIDELGRVIGQYRESALAMGKTLTEFIATHLNSGVPDFVATGKIMETNLSRYDAMTHALQSLTSASSAMKPFVFLKNIDLSIAKGTLQNFAPGVPVTLEGIVYALCGLLFGMIVYAGIKWVVRTAIEKNQG